MSLLWEIGERSLRNALQKEHQSLLAANRRRCSCSSEPLSLSLQPTEGRPSTFFFSFHPLVDTAELVRCQRIRQGFWANHFVTREEERERERERKKGGDRKRKREKGEGWATATLTLNLPFSAKSCIFGNTVRFIILLHGGSRRRD